ncbi:MAG: hypothetical protein IKG21_04715 [Atopobiaceae bacterium]|nr:hypothetical protein [Atopobiaceae bacterium]
MLGRKHSENETEATEQSKLEQTGDMPVAQALTTAGSGARSAAGDAGRSIVGGLTALKQVRLATKMRADCEADIRDIERGLDEDNDELAHRVDVERNYEYIVSAQEADMQEARAEMDRAEAEIRKRREQATRLEDELRTMREQHEQELRPYRNLMDSSRGRSDDAAKSLANVRRTTRNAERALGEATKNRDARISAAHRAVDNAQERVGTLDADLNALRMSADADGADAAAIAKTENELASNQRALDFARSEVVQVTQEAQDAVDQAQRKLLALQRELAQAEKLAETSKAEATAAKDEYDSMYRDSQAKEKAHEDAIKSCETRIRELTQVRNAAEGRYEDAKDVLDEANEIHAHPETTAGLRERIAAEEADLEDALAELDELTAQERALRRSTRGSRIAIIAIALVVLFIIALCVWFFVLN